MLKVGVEPPTFAFRLAAAPFEQAEATITDLAARSSHLRQPCEQSFDFQYTDVEGNRGLAVASRM